MAAPKGKPMHKLNTLTMAIMLAEMLDGPFTVKGLVEATGLSPDTLYGIIGTFKAKDLIHISAWDRDTLGRICVPVYSFGVGENVKRRRKSKKAVNLDYVRRKREREAMTIRPAEEERRAA